MFSKAASPFKLATNTDHAIDRSAPEPVAAQKAEEDLYFSEHEAPEYLDSMEVEVREFMELHRKENRKIAVITSGGTTVPLENQTVRFIDNFSNGTRGATSAEYFLEAGYAVIFLHRQFSLLPYSRHYSHTTNCFLDYMKVNDDGAVEINDHFKSDMAALLEKYKAAKDSQLLLMLPFTTVNQYLFSLKMIATVLKPLESNVVFYLAAAVSDFFVPQSRISEHKIQSQGNRLVIDLDPVPKFLRRLVDDWAPGAMIVSFKLETDPSILIDKAKQALHRYKHQLVIGNLLTTRKSEVVFVSPDSVEWIKLSKEEMDEGVEIESKFIPLVVAMHKHWVDLHSSSQHQQQQQQQQQ
ncbi:hypothetical protein CANCADRAFT_99924 [Tortispora caseinolytica NRRL Y-17796]|uniref:DNA/pantothenate metabolism flavoprotein C-terminal domain-containing protein n=1 Tax=Tortispora caseinolytica NRRL Y-17796 TaxID=767744 RepID=A0A1E4TE47_9ASCO|nr:hypothetical protein CANCADRAFT_99924 [Tortispora caseinolytica NRRL Y-17796]